MIDWFSSTPQRDETGTNDKEGKSIQNSSSLQTVQLKVMFDLGPADESPKCVMASPTFMRGLLKPGEIWSPQPHEENKLWGQCKLRSRFTLDVNAVGTIL